MQITTMLFGIPPEPESLDPEDLKKRFYERSRQWHPDRFSRAARPNSSRRWR